jgi:Tfp pilus assembly protein PilV
MKTMQRAGSGTCRRGQHGFTLVVGMIMLVLMTLLAISAFQASNVNLRIAGNMQVRQETLTAAQTALEKALSSSAFTKTAVPIGSSTVNLNGASYTVDFTPAPTCTSVIDIPSEDLDPASPTNSPAFPVRPCRVPAPASTWRARHSRPRTARTRAGR